MLTENEKRILCAKWVCKAKLSMMIKTGHKDVLMKM